MSATPCESNDNLLLDLGLNRRQSTQNNVGSGCNDAGSTTEANQENDMQVTDPEVTPTFSASSVATFLSCTTTDALDLTNSNDVERIELAYDYDIQVTNTADLSFAVSVFELDLLKVIADESGLSSCAFGRRSLRHGRRKLNSTGASSLVLGGIGSNPADVVDTTRNCMENTVSTDESSTCAPMIGIMTAWVEKTTGAGLVKSDIYKIIEKYISVYATDEGVLSMTYIGTRPEVILSDAELAFLNEPTAMEPGALAGIAVASVLALLATLALIAMKRIYKPKKSKKISSSPTNGALVMGGDDDKDNDVLEIVFDDDSTNSAHTECCTVAETVGSSGKQESFGSSPCGGEPLKDEGYELSYDQVISMRENSHP